MMCCLYLFGFVPYGAAIYVRKLLRRTRTAFDVATAENKAQ